ncbi:hypothetical protein ACFLQR_00535 [Verrucomicrobiota bacterium]
MLELQPEYKDKAKISAVHLRGNLRKLISDIQETIERLGRQGTLLQDKLVQKELDGLISSAVKVLRPVCLDKGLKEWLKSLDGVEAHLRSLKSDLPRYPIAHAVMTKMTDDLSLLHERL